MSNNNEHKPGYKHSPLGWIPEEWSVKKLGEIAKIKHGKDQKQIEEFNGKYPILGTGGEMGRTNSYLYNKPSVLIGRKGTIDKPRFMDTPFWTVDTLFYTELSDDIIPKWLFNVFQRINWYLYNEASGVPSLSGSTISAIPIAVPLISEQRQIATILSTWDEAITKTHQLIAQLQERNKGLIQQLLTGKKRLKGFEEEWKNIPLGSIIEEFREQSAGNNQYEVLTSSKRGLVKQRDYFGANRLSERDNEGFNVIPSGYITYRSRSDDGIFTFNINEFDYTGIISIYYPVFKVKVGSNRYIISLLNFFNHKVGRYSVGTSQLVLSINDLKSIHIDIPSPKEQLAIAECLEMALGEVRVQEQKLSTLQQQKKGLMQKLLTGEVRVKI